LLQAAIVALVLLNVACRERVLRCDELEANHFAASTQLIVWEYRNGERWPVDWVVSPKGRFDGERWWDENGTVVCPVQLVESWTDHDPERRSYNWWRARGCRREQGGFWHETQVTSP